MSNGPTAIWDSLNFEELPQNRLVIDGSNLALWLSNSTKKTIPSQELGGSYPTIYEVMVRFLEALTTTYGVRPVVVFDGVKQLAENAQDRRVERFLDMYRYQKGECKRFCTYVPSPLMIRNVFLDALHDDRVQGSDIHFVSEDAQAEVVAIANSIDCPVLSSDSEFYIYKINRGFIPLANVQLSDERELLSPLVKVFHLDRFVRHFKLEDEDLCLLLPAILGNDEVSELADSLQLQASDDDKAVTQVIECLVDAARNPALLSDLEKARKKYKSLPIPSYPHTPAIEATGTFSKLLPHYRDLFRQGRFQTFMAEVLVRGKCVFHQVFEDATLPSALISSLSIRRAIYTILGCTSPVFEFRRAKEPSPGWIPVDFSSQPPVPANEVPKKSQEECKSIMLSILHYDHSLIADLPPEWHLPVVATRFWYTQNQRKSFAKALVATFVACQSSTIDIESHDFPRPNTGTSELEFAHCLTQWQCVYFDTVALNQLLLEPFQYVSPARLFDGLVAAYFVNKSKKRELTSGGFELYHKLLSAIFLPVPDHEKRAPKAAPNLYGIPVHENRFALLAKMKDRKE